MSSMKDDIRDLFGHVQPESGRARSADPDTSRIAADMTDAKTLQALVYKALKAGGDMTQWEVSWALKLSKQKISPRFVQLEERGLIKRIGKRKALNDSGKMTLQETWRAISS